MDRLNESQQWVDDLASRVFEPRSDGANQSTSSLWDAVSRSDLLTLALPADVGGSELGTAELCLVLFHAGRNLVDEPLWQTLCAAALPLARFGRPEADDLLVDIGKGAVRVSAALVEGTLGEWREPRTTVSASTGSGWTINGTKTFVDVVENSTHLLVSATDPGGRGALVLVDPADPGVRLSFSQVTDERMVATVELTDARAMFAPITGGDAVADILSWCVDRVYAALCAMHAGVAHRALELTAEHVRTREQFGKPLGAFQAVAMRSADAYMDVDAMRATVWAAAVALDSAAPDTAERIAVANVCGKSAGARVVASAQHLHGGLGVDTTYPLHRYFLASKRLQLAFGPANAHLEDLGALLVAP